MPFSTVMYRTTASAGRRAKAAGPIGKTLDLNNVVMQVARARCRLVDLSCLFGQGARAGAEIDTCCLGHSVKRQSPPRHSGDPTIQIADRRLASAVAGCQMLSRSTCAGSHLYEMDATPEANSILFSVLRFRQLLGHMTGNVTVHCPSRGLAVW